MLHLAENESQFREIRTFSENLESMHQVLKYSDAGKKKQKTSKYNKVTVKLPSLFKKTRSVTVSVMKSLNTSKYRLFVPQKAKQRSSQDIIL